MSMYLIAQVLCVGVDFFFNSSSKRLLHTHTHTPLVFSFSPPLPTPPTHDTQDERLPHVRCGCLAAAKPGGAPEPTLRKEVYFQTHRSKTSRETQQYTNLSLKQPRARARAS